MYFILLQVYQIYSCFARMIPYQESSNWKTIYV